MRKLYAYMAICGIMYYIFHFSTLSKNSNTIKTKNIQIFSYAYFLIIVRHMVPTVILLGFKSNMNHSILMILNRVALWRNNNVNIITINGISRIYIRIINYSN